MARFNRTRPSWSQGGPATPAELADLDSKIARAINADRGGCWSPSTQLSIAGAGFRVSGPTVLQGRGALETQSGARVVLGDVDWPELGAGHPARRRTIVYPCALGRAHPSYGARVRADYAALQGVAQRFAEAGAPDAELALIVPMRMHDGARLSRVTLTLRVPTAHKTVPPILPRVRIVQLDEDSRVVPLSSVAAGADVNGFVTAPRPTNAEAWSGLQTITILCDQFNAIEIARCHYAAEIREELSTENDAPWRLVVTRPCRCATTGNVALTSLSPTNVDIVSLSTGDRVLVKDQTDATQNGIYVASGGAWTRADDPLPRGAIVPVTFGFSPDGLQGGTHWQLADGNTFATPPTPRGTIYHALTCEFDSIPSLRFQ